MSTDKLYVQLSFTGLAIGGSATLTHGLKLNGIALVPDVIIPQYPSSFEVTATTTTQVTLRNTANAAGSCIVHCYAIHPVMRMLGMTADDGTMSEHMTPQPFVLGSPNAGDPGGAGALAISAVLTSNTVLTTADQVVRVDPTGGAFSVTLPAAAGVRGQVIFVKNVSNSGANAVTVAAGGGDTIDGAATVVLAGARFFWEAVSDGVSSWLVVG